MFWAWAVLPEQPVGQGCPRCGFVAASASLREKGGEGLDLWPFLSSPGKQQIAKEGLDPSSASSAAVAAEHHVD